MEVPYLPNEIVYFVSHYPKQPKEAKVLGYNFETTELHLLLLHSTGVEKVEASRIFASKELTKEYLLEEEKKAKIFSANSYREHILRLNEKLKQVQQLELELLKL